MRHFQERNYLLSLMMGLLMLAMGLFAVTVSNSYATERASNSVTDIILSNTHAHNVGIFFVYGAIAMVIFIIVVVMTQVPRLPFALKTIGLFCLIRSMFVSLTHLSAFPDQIVLSQSYFTTSHYFALFFTGDDFFFSGHTGLPFLIALIFWDHIILRYVFLALSVFFAVIVLMGHLHYSIDVFSAYFITYSIYAIALKLFSVDHALARSK